jgi:dTDP-4-dehydrorhamnose reductase
LKLLVVGVQGQLGRSITSLAPGHGWEVVGTYHHNRFEGSSIPELHLDKTDADNVRDVMDEVHPTAVVDTGALHNVDYCEDHPEEAFAVNRQGTRNIADAAHRLDARFTFVSTDYVFDGLGQPPYTELAPVHPLSIYGVSKWEGEQSVLAVDPKALVVRTSVIYSWTPRIRRVGHSSSGKPLNFGSWVVHELEQGKELRIVKDQVASPTLADDLARAILQLQRGPAQGIFHAAGATALSRFDFCRALANRLGLSEELIHPVLTRELNQKALRPPDSSLRSERILAETGHRMQTVPESLNEFASRYFEDPPR